jgi:predicted hydrocarbon binding protein
MELSPLLLKLQEEAIQQGFQQGRIKERRRNIENFLRVRFGVLDEELSIIVEPMLELQPEEFAVLLLQLSREELLARFSS